MNYKSNFYFIKDEWNDIYNLCENAELYFAKEDYNTVIIKARQVAEKIVRVLIDKECVNENRIEKNQYNRLNILKNKNIIDTVTFEKFNSIRIYGNSAVHELNKSKLKAKESIENLLSVCTWFQKKYGKSKNFKIEAFKLDKNLKVGIEDRINQNESKIKEQDEKIKEIAEKYNEILALMKINEVKKEIAIDSVSKENDSSDNTKKIGEIVRLGFEKILKDDLLTETDILNLKDSIWCKNVLGVNYPVLKEINDINNSNKARYINGYSRYWSKVYNISNSNYYICNDWYEKNRSKFVSWISKKVDILEFDENVNLAEDRTPKKTLKIKQSIDESQKPLNRIPLWSKRSEQCNYKILRAYLKLSKTNIIVTEEMIEKMCSDNINHKDTYVEKFKGNFKSMQRSEGNNHGKIFVVKDEKVTLWDEIEREVIKYQDEFLKD